MDKLDFKKNLYNLCLERQNEIINHFKSLMEETQQSANEYGPPKDRYDSYRMQLLRKQDMYAQQLEKALAESDTLNKVDISKIYDKVCFGSVVYTNDQKLFISVSLGKVEFNENIFYAVSVKVPFYNVIKDKKIGETFVFNGKNNQILDIF